jgi:hypothetical protein
VKGFAARPVVVAASSGYYYHHMTKLLEQAIAKARELPEQDQDALAALLLFLTEADASSVPLDEKTRAAIHQGLAQAQRGEFVPDDVVARSDKRHGI